MVWMWLVPKVSGVKLDFSVEIWGGLEPLRDGAWFEVFRALRMLPLEGVELLRAKWPLKSSSGFLSHSVICLTHVLAITPSSIKLSSQAEPIGLLDLRFSASKTELNKPQLQVFCYSKENGHYNTVNKSKNRYMGLHQNKSFCATKKSYNRMKRDSLWNGRKYLQIIHLIRSLYPKYTRNSIARKLKNGQRTCCVPDKFPPKTH